MSLHSAIKNHLFLGCSISCCKWQLNKLKKKPTKKAKQQQQQQTHHKKTPPSWTFPASGAAKYQSIHKNKEEDSSKLSIHQAIHCSPTERTCRHNAYKKQPKIRISLKSLDDTYINIKEIYFVILTRTLFLSYIFQCAMITKSTLQR